ncbi:hypothetical protein [Salmonella enterica]|uniref:hypothetical protein n=1 Tax=Salmonella enterica TaxID=28901 RepID=UPI001116AEF6|nr:hypothetical protein [Salmonella enterica]
MPDLRKYAWILVCGEGNQRRHVNLDEVKALPSSAIEYLRCDVNFSVLMLLIALDNYPFTVEDFIYNEKANTGKYYEIARLFIDNPGTATLKANKDHFVQRDRRVTAICPQCYPGIAYAYTQLIGAGGRGYRPGAASDRCLYIVDADTIGGIISRNKLPDDSPHISRYFTSPVYLSPVTSNEKRTCDICGITDRCYTGIYVAPFPLAKEVSPIPAHPHASLSAGGNETSFAQWKAKFQAIANIVDVEYATPPPVVTINAKEGDMLRFLGLGNPQAVIRNFQSFAFRIPERRSWTGETRIFNYVVRKLFAINHPGQDFTPEIAGNEYGQLSELIVKRGMTTAEAGVYMLDSMFASPESTMSASSERIFCYVKTRKAFVNIHRARMEWKERYCSEIEKVKLAETPRELDTDATRFYWDILRKLKTLKLDNEVSSPD